MYGVVQIIPELHSFHKEFFPPPHLSLSSAQLIPDAKFRLLYIKLF